MTATGQILGSPAHMAPEQVEGGDTDARSDIFALGTILYWLATGTLPFTGKNPHQVLKRVVDSTPVDPLVLRPAIGRDLRDIIVRCLAKAPADRYQTAESLALDLEAHLRGLGIEDSHETLEAFLRDPGAEAQRLHAQVLQGLLVQARKAVAARDRPRAITVIDRVLALEDGTCRGIAPSCGPGSRSQAQDFCACCHRRAVGFRGRHALGHVRPPVPGDRGSCGRSCAQRSRR